MSTDNRQLAQDILMHIGGEENIQEAWHCMTRLRFRLKDKSKAETEYFKQHDDIVTVVENSGQYQVVVGNHVAEVYQELMAITQLSDLQAIAEENTGESEGVFNQFIDIISGIFQPFLYPLAAAGMIKGIVAVMAVLGVPDTDGTYIVLNALGDGFFQFLPFMIAVTASNKFKMNQFVALGLVGLLLYPTLMNTAELPVLYTLFEGTLFESQINAIFLGIPLILPQGSYYGTVIPVILTIFFASRVEKAVSRLIPSVIRSAMTPFATFLIAGPIALLLIGPVASWLTNLIAGAVMLINDFSPVLLGAVLGGAWQVLVMFGLHWGIAPFMMIVQLAESGQSNIGAIINAVAFTQLGVLLALMIKSKEQKVRTLGIPASISALFGVTEPAIYGLSLPLKTPFIISCIAGAIQGAFIGLMDISYYVLGGMGIFSIASYIDPTGEKPNNVWLYVINIAIALAVSFILMYFAKTPTLVANAFEETDAELNTTTPILDEVEEVADQKTDEIIGSPLVGTMISLKDVADPVFSGGLLGKGLAIIPQEGRVVAPFNAEVTTLFPTGHAIGLTSDNGLELLIHVGMDTVELDGGPFNALVQQGDRVSAGQTLIEFDIQAIQAAGFEIATPIVVTNSNDYIDVVLTEDSVIQTTDYLMTALGKQ